MMNKKIRIILSIIIVIMLATFGAYLVDKNRMANNKPVIFGTWGAKYSQPLERENVTEKIPNLSESNTANNTTENNASVINKTESIKIKENETVIIDLLDGWKYEISENLNDMHEYGISFYSPNTNNKMTLYEYKNLFGVCGTGLIIKEITLDDGNVEEVGFYDNNECWSFVIFEDNLAMLNEGLTLEESNSALSMIKTIKFVKQLPGNITEINRDKDKVTIEVLLNTVTSKGATIIVTDKNE